MATKGSNTKNFSQVKSIKTGFSDKRIAEFSKFIADLESDNKQLKIEIELLQQKISSKKADEISF